MRARAGRGVGRARRPGDGARHVDRLQGSVRQMHHAGLSCSRVSKVFITHMHGDHCLGLPGLICAVGHAKVHQPFEEAPAPCDVAAGHSCAEAPEAPAAGQAENGCAPRRCAERGLWR